MKGTPFSLSNNNNTYSKINTHSASNNNFSFTPTKQRSSTTNTIQSSTVPNIRRKRRSRSLSGPPKFISRIIPRSPRNIQSLSPTNHEAITHSNPHSPPRNILPNHNDNESSTKTKIPLSISTHSRCRSRSRSLSNNQNRHRNSNHHPSPDCKSKSPIDISYINNNIPAVIKQRSNSKTRPRKSWSNPHSRSKSHVSRFNSSYRSTFSNNTRTSYHHHGHS